jgi:hypothetical protein
MGDAPKARDAIADAVVEDGPGGSEGLQGR